MKYLPTTRGREKQAKQQFTWFFGADVMRQNTAATLDVTKMREIKNIILGIYGLEMHTRQECTLGQVQKSDRTKVQIESAL